jgi:signal transduction histidine kinase/ActR/RegA family two-component response regulator/PAS domain-containing protein
MATAELQRLLRAVPGMFALLRPDAGFTIAGASADYLQTLHTDESIVGRPFFEAFPDNPAAGQSSGNAALRESLDRVKATRQSHQMALVRYDIRLPAAEGSQFEERYWHPLNTPVLDDDGNLEFIVHRVEEAAAKANRKAVEILESITEGFFTLDRQWRFDYVNPEAHRILDVEPGSLERRVIWDVYPGLEETPFWDCYHRTMEMRVKTSFTAHYESQERWYEVTVFPAPEGVSVYFRDVTAHKTLEARREALTELSRQLGNTADRAQAAHAGAAVIGTALKVSRVGYGTIDQDSGQLFVERDWSRPDVASLSGVTPLRDYGSFIDSMERGEFIAIADVRLDARTARAAAALESRQARSFVNVPVLKHGRLVAVLFVNDDKVRDWTPDELQFIQEAAAYTRTAVERATAEAVLRDSEERHRRLSAELAEASRMKDEFLAMLAHELRNPLAPIRNALKIQSIAAHDPALVARSREMMERQVAHMVRLIDDLLDVARLSRGLIDLKLERVSLSTALSLALEASGPSIDQSSHALAVCLPDEELVVLADPVRITQIVTNLLNNAAKFTPAGGKLRLSLERDGGFALLRVEDNGIGLRSDMLERVFNMFEQVDRSHAQVSGGLGIGLTLVKRLVEAQGGTVRAGSAGLGQGSEFSVRLPLAPPSDDVAAHLAGEERPAGQGVGQRILIADDNADAAMSLATFFDMNGNETRVATDGAQAVAIAREFQPHVAVLDIAMPVLDGLQAARAIRALPGGERVLLLALSGFGRGADKRRSIEAGFDEHLVKPADLARIEWRVATHSGADEPPA